MRATFVAGGIAAVMLAAAVGAGNTHKNVHIFSARGRDAYALVLGGHWMSTNQSIEEVERIRGQYDGDFLWVRRHGESYMLRDDAKLKEARGLFDALRELEPAQRDLARRLRPVEHKEAALDREIDGLEDSGDDEDRADRDAALDRSRDEKIRELDSEKKKVEFELRRLEREESELDRHSDELERAAETKLWVLIDGWIADGTARKPSER